MTKLFASSAIAICGKEKLMNHGHHNEPGGADKPPSRFKWVFIGFAAIAAYLLITEHQTHVSGWLAKYGIWLVLLACPLMHLFMHGGHGGRGGHRSQRDDEAQASDKQPKGQAK
ncbi:MAG TPA: DUF2933 domain-containing protein [Gemmatimonadales bacterium]|nr:DUF2933 domain-containing protein [Gemmatimonadales bacterium]